MNEFTPAPDGPEPVPFGDAVQATLRIREEWEMVERGGEDLPDAERVAYQEGLLRALEILNSEVGITVETLPDDALEKLGAEREPPENPDAPQEATECPACGGERTHGLGGGTPVCPNCDR